MKLAFYLAHPSQFYVFKYIITNLVNRGHTITIFIKTKDILEKLLIENELNYINIYREKRKNNIFGLIQSYIKKNIKLYTLLRRKNIDLLITTASDISLVTYLLKIPSIILNDDDYSIIPFSSIIGWPFSSIILAPMSCEMGYWKRKTIFYSAYQKTAYLHPGVFKPNLQILDKYNLAANKYFIIRTVSLVAHHDRKVRGLNNDLVRKIIDKLNSHGEIIISSERSLPYDLKYYQKKLSYSDIHHLIYYSRLLIADSQSMCHEAALLGTPSIRYNDIAGRIGVLNELENIHKVAFSIKPDNQYVLLAKIEEIIKNELIITEFKQKSEKINNLSINLTFFAIWFIENYPDSVRIIKENPDYQYRFR